MMITFVCDSCGNTFRTQSHTTGENYSEIWIMAACGQCGVGIVCCCAGWPHDNSMLCVSQTSTTHFGWPVWSVNLYSSRSNLLFDVNRTLSEWTITNCILLLGIQMWIHNLVGIAMSRGLKSRQFHDSFRWTHNFVVVREQSMFLYDHKHFRDSTHFDV